MPVCLRVRMSALQACLHVCMHVRVCVAVSMCMYVSMCIYVSVCMYVIVQAKLYARGPWAPKGIVCAVNHAPTPWIAGHGVHLRRMSPTMLHPQLLLCVCERVEVLVFSAFLSRTSLPPSLPLSLSIFSLSLSLFYRSPSTYTLSFSTAPRD